MPSTGPTATQRVAPAPPAARPAASRLAALVGLSARLVALNLAVLAPARHFAFVSWDDPAYVSDNAAVKRGLTMDTVGWALTNPGHSYRHPLTRLSHMADVEMFGLDAGRHHLTSLALPAGATLLLFFALRRMTGRVYRIALGLATGVVTFLTQRQQEAVSTLREVPVGDRLAHAAAAVAVVRARSSRPYLAVGWFWYLVMLLPVAGLVQVGSQSMADRFTDLPLVGLLIASVWTLAVAARVQAGYWKDSEALWRRAVEAVPDNDLAYANLGRVLADAGRADEALADFNEALRIVETQHPAPGTGRGGPPPEYAAILHGSRGLLLAQRR